MVSGIPNISVPIFAYSASQGDKISFPVDSSSLIYSHFEHVSGTAAPEGTEGVKITKLNLLDVLIGQLNQIKRAPAPVAGPDAGHLDALIESCMNQIRQAKDAGANMPYVASPSAQSGTVFSLTA